jgi:predicted dehydrogenase
MSTNTRRDFILKSTLALGGLALAPVAFSFNSNEKIRIGIIGTGDRGTGLATEINNLPDFQLVAGCDIQKDRLANFMKNVTGGKAYTDYRQLLDNKDIDAVIISSPLYLHQPMAMDAIDSGKHVYCEKTMAYNIEQSLQLSKKVKGSGKVFMVGHQYRHYPLYAGVLQKIKEGHIGDVKHFICHYNRNSNWRKPVTDPSLERIINWKMYREYCGGLATELSAHQIDILNYMFDSPPEKISGFGSINYWKDGRETYDNINLVFAYPNNITGTVSCHLSNEHQPYVVKLIGTKGAIEIHRTQAFFYPESTTLNKPVQTGVVDGVSGATKPMEAGKSYQIPISLKEGYDATTYALIDFADCIRNNKIPASNVNTGRMSAIACHLANSAMDNNRIEYWKPEYNA